VPMKPKKAALLGPEANHREVEDEFFLLHWPFRRPQPAGDACHSQVSRELLRGSRGIGAVRHAEGGGGAGGGVGWGGVGWGGWLAGWLAGWLPPHLHVSKDEIYARLGSAVVEILV
jgi:hypothetical protein